MKDSLMLICRLIFNWFIFSSFFMKQRQHTANKRTISIRCHNDTQPQVYEHYYFLSLPWKSTILHLFCWKFFCFVFSIRCCTINIISQATLANTEYWTILSTIMQTINQMLPESSYIHVNCIDSHSTMAVATILLNFVLQGDKSRW